MPASESSRLSSGFAQGGGCCSCFQMFSMNLPRRAGNDHTAGGLFGQLDIETLLENELRDSCGRREAGGSAATGNVPRGHDGLRRPALCARVRLPGQSPASDVARQSVTLVTPSRARHQCEKRYPVAASEVAEGSNMPLFLNVLQILFAVAGLALLIRAAWLLARGEYRHGLIHMGLAGLSFIVAVGFFLASDLFVPAA